MRNPKPLQTLCLQLLPILRRQTWGSPPATGPHLCPPPFPLLVEWTCGAITTCTHNVPFTISLPHNHILNHMSIFGGGEPIFVVATICVDVLRGMFGQGPHVLCPKTKPH